MNMFPEIHATTILGVSHNGKVALGGDGQVTFGDTVMKHSAVKIRSIYDGDVLAGFAGSASSEAWSVVWLIALSISSLSHPTKNNVGTKSMMNKILMLFIVVSPYYTFKLFMR